MSIDTVLFRRVMGSFPTGVTIVTTTCEGVPHGMTVNAITSLSLDPILILFCAEKTTRTHDMIRRSKVFAVNILTHDMVRLSDRFAGREGNEDERFAGVPYVTAKTNAPILEGTMGWLDCTVACEFEGGDHTIFVGEVIDGEIGSAEGEPLVFYRGRYVALDAGRSDLCAHKDSSL